MGRPPSREEAQAWKRRWAAVNAFGREELRRTSLDQKVRDLADLMAWADGLGWSAALSEDDMVVWSMWARLKKRRERGA